MFTKQIWKEPRPDRHGHIERSKSTLDIKSNPGTGSQQPVVDRQTNLFPGSPRVLFVETVQGPLFLSTNQNYYCTCLQNFKRRDPFNPNFWKFRGRIKRNGNFRKVRIDKDWATSGGCPFSVPLVIPFRQMLSASFFSCDYIRRRRRQRKQDLKITLAFSE